MSVAARLEGSIARLGYPDREGNTREANEARAYATVLGGSSNFEKRVARAVGGIYTWRARDCC